LGKTNEHSENEGFTWLSRPHDGETVGFAPAGRPLLNDPEVAMPPLLNLLTAPARCRCNLPLQPVTAT
jgi:hypothetical protein